MWLINTTSLELEYVNDPEDHVYVILSHTWGDGEVTFQDFATLQKARTKGAFFKIERTCELARDYGYNYAWVDTCCIDKSSSAELSEAINSMFRWYKMAAVCFVYLSDLSSSLEERVMRDGFPLCRWFTRGWTLQELLASNDIYFYDEEWGYRGNKITLGKQLSVITNIEVRILENSDHISSVPVARRISWAATRQTTRVEDLSYCLFGIFDIHLPLIYGEGPKAFIRLQEAIAADNNDLSLLAWTSPPGDQLFRGVLAKSPSEFKGCGSLKRVTAPFILSSEFSLTNKGLRMNTRLKRVGAYFLLNLQCFNYSEHQSYPTLIGIRLIKTAQDYVRYEPSRPCSYDYTDSKRSEELPIYVARVISPKRSDTLCLVPRRLGVSIQNTSTFSYSVQGRPDHLWEPETNTFITDGHEDFTAILEITIRGGQWGDLSHASRLESKYVIVLGLEEHKGRATDEEYGPLCPWASIHHHDGSADRISRLLHGEAEHGLPQVLTDMRRHLRLRSSGGQASLQNALEATVLLWKDTGMGQESAIMKLQTSVRTLPGKTRFVGGKYEAALSISSTIAE